MTFDVIAKDKEFIRHLIFDGVEEDVDWVNTLMKGQKLYTAWGALGKFLAKNYGDATEKIKKESDELETQLHLRFDPAESNHVSLVMQQVMDIMGARTITTGRYEELKK